MSMTDKAGRQTPTGYAETFDHAATVDGLFDILDSAIGSASKVTVEYDAKYGYPTFILIDNSIATDDEINYTVENFQAVK